MNGKVDEYFPMHCTCPITPPCMISTSRGHCALLDIIRKLMAGDVDHKGKHGLVVRRYNHF